MTVYESDKISLFGTPAIGTQFLDDDPGRPPATPTRFFASPSTANINLPNVTGTLLIDPGPMFKVAKGTIPGSGVERIVPTAPNNPGLGGQGPSTCRPSTSADPYGSRTAIS